MGQREVLTVHAFFRPVMAFYSKMQVKIWKTQVLEMINFLDNHF